MPFHTTVRGLLSRHGGRLARDEGGVHVELAIDGGFVAAGLHRPPAAVLRPIRDAIIERPDEFQGIVDRLTADGYPLTDGTVATMPRGFERFAGEPYADHLRRTTLTIVRRLDPDDWTDGGAHTATVELCRAAMDLLAFVDTAIGASRPEPLAVGRVGTEPTTDG